MGRIFLRIRISYPCSTLSDSVVTVYEVLSCLEFDRVSWLAVIENAVDLHEALRGNLIHEISPYIKRGNPFPYLQCLPITLTFGLTIR